MNELFAFLESGGPVMVPIGLASLVGFGALLGRVAALRRARVVPEGFPVELEGLLQQGRLEDAELLCRRRESTAAARVARVALQARGRPRSALKERIEEVGRREAAELERGADIIGTVAAVAPLLGLLGTVWGMIQTFAVIQEQGMGVVGSLAGGISQALITTLAGLSVGIPAVISHRWVLARVDQLTMELEDVALIAIDLLSDEAVRS